MIGTDCMGSCKSKYLTITTAWPKERKKERKKKREREKKKERKKESKIRRRNEAETVSL